jgi:hypothetical protein
LLAGLVEEIIYRANDVGHSRADRFGKISSAEFLPVREPEHAEAVMDRDRQHFAAPG